MQATSDAIRLLLGVARLGEADLAGWWGSQALAPAGRYVLSRTFRRTWRPAAGQLLLLTATRWHQQLFDRRATALHLYSDRLPFHGWTASWLAEQKTTMPPDPLFDQLIWADTDQAVADLAVWVGNGNKDRPEAVAGHLRLGSLAAADVATPARLGPICRSLAACYLYGDGTLTVPYFDLTS